MLLTIVNIKHEECFSKIEKKTKKLKKNCCQSKASKTESNCSNLIEVRIVYVQLRWVVLLLKKEIILLSEQTNLTQLTVQSVISFIFGDKKIDRCIYYHFRVLNFCLKNNFLTQRNLMQHLNPVYFIHSI